MKNSSFCSFVLKMTSSVLFYACLCSTPLLGGANDKPIDYFRDCVMSDRDDEPIDYFRDWVMSDKDDDPLHLAYKELGIRSLSDSESSLSKEVRLFLIEKSIADKYGFHDEMYSIIAQGIVEFSNSCLQTGRSRLTSSASEESILFKNIGDLAPPDSIAFDEIGRWLKFLDEVIYNESVEIEDINKMQAFVASIRFLFAARRHSSTSFREDYEFESMSFYMKNALKKVKNES